MGALGAGDQLVQHRQGVAGRAAAGADHQRVDGVVDGDALLLADPPDQRPHGLRRQQPERVVMRARPDRRQHLLRFGGRKDEDEVFGGLLDDLQQRVETRRRHHVRLVDDEHAVARLGGGVERAVAQLAGVVHTAVAGGVELDHVDAARRVGCQGLARVADPARGGRRALSAVQRAGQDARRGGLSAAPGPGEQVGVVDPPRFQGNGQRFGDVLLPHYFGEGCRAVFAVEGHGQQATGAR
ncbi:hypothetical protein MYSE111917_21350 [Mycobacterium senriense]